MMRKSDILLTVEGSVDDSLLAALDDNEFDDILNALNQEFINASSSSSSASSNRHESLMVKTERSPTTVAQSWSPRGVETGFRFFPVRTTSVGLTPAEARQRRKTILLEKRASRLTGLQHKASSSLNKVHASQRLRIKADTMLLTTEEKRARRQAKNHESAIASRQKKEAHLNELKYHDASFRKQNAWLMSQYEILRSNYDFLSQNTTMHHAQPNDARVAYLLEQNRLIEERLIALPDMFKRDFSLDYQSIRIDTTLPYDVAYDEWRRKKNRVSAAISRQRKDDKISELEASVNLLNEQKNVLTEIYQLLVSALRQAQSIPMDLNSDMIEDEYDYSLLRRGY